MKAPAIVKSVARAVVGKSARAALDEAQRQVEKLEAEMEAATETLVTMAEARLAASGQPDDVLDALDERCERAKILQERARERHRLACEAVDRAEAELDREMAADRAQRAAAIRAKIEPLVAPAYAEAAKGVLLAMRHIAKADLELAELEANPDGRPPRSVEHNGRFRGWLSEQEVSRREVALWTDLAGTILAPQPAASRIGEGRDGQYLMKDSGSNSVQFRVQKSRFSRIEFKVDKLNRINWVRSIVSQISLPGIGDPDTQLWPPAREPIAREPAELLRQLDAALALVDEQLEALQKRRDDRPVEVRFERLQDEPKAVEPPAGDETNEDGEAE